MTKRFCGVDPSLSATGVVIIDSEGVILERKLIRTKPNKDTARENVNELLRLRHITNAVIDFALDCEYVAIEGLAFMARNTTALVQLSALNYFIREDLREGSVDFVVVSPSSLKKFVSGKGNCKKDLMFLETYKRYGETFSDDNLCDAYGLAQVSRGLSIEPDTEFQKEVVRSVKTQL